MQHARHLASIAVIAVVGVLALSGCRSEPGVAAYVGDKKFTEDQVTRIVDDAKQKPVQEGVPSQPPARDLVVSVLVLNDICSRLSATQGYQSAIQVSPEQVGQAFGVAADSEYAGQTAQLYSCLSGIPAAASTAPSAEELADVVARARAAGVLPADVSDEQAAAQLDGGQLRSALAKRKVLADAVSRYDVTVNPRYRPLEFPVLSFQGNVAAVVLPLGEGESDTVIDPR